MGTIIFSCSNDLENLKICIKEKIIGFRRMHYGISKGDTVYLAIRMPKINFCCAKAIISNKTDYIPWRNPELYVLCYRIENIEFCTPFSLDILKNTSAKNAWGAVYIRGNRLITDLDALTLLAENFNKNISNKFYPFKDTEINPPKGKRGRKKKNINDAEMKNILIETSSDEDEDEEIDNPNTLTDIMSTFKVVKFKSEKHKSLGLEGLVNNNFYKLFNNIQEENSILIPHDRMFPTKGKDGVNGTIGIPDAVLISFDKNDKKSYIKINIIEYECYGEEKSTSKKKFDHFTGHIIPQLIKFASTFSVVTDNQIRQDTKESWIDKIVEYCGGFESRISEWIKQLNPDVRQSQWFDKFRKELHKAFENNIRIMLIIDEMTDEQRATIKNMINSFKLKDRNKSCYIDFSAHVVRLESLLSYDENTTSKYALSIQDSY